MSGKLKLKGHLKHLARWPLYLSVLLIALNVLVYVISIKAGIVVTMGIILYVGAAIGLLFYHRPLMFNDLIAFASQYEFLEKKGSGGVCSSICSNGYAGKDDLVQQGILTDHRQGSVLPQKCQYDFCRHHSRQASDRTWQRNHRDQYTVWRAHLSCIHAESPPWRIRGTIETSDGYPGQHQPDRHVSLWRDRT